MTTLFLIIAGVLISSLLNYVYRVIPNESYRLKIAAAVSGSIFSALFYTLFNLVLKDFWGQSQSIETTFGSLFFDHFLIFLCWNGLFHSLQFYRQIELDKKDILKVQAQVQEEQQKRSAAQSQARITKIKMLRYQLTPHFLCNTLNAINSLIETQSTEKAQQMTVQLSRFLRYSLDNNPVIALPLENELNAIQLYLDIEKTRFGERLQLDFQISEQAKFALVPSLLIQPIIENSMKHVIARNEEGGTIKLVAQIMDQQLCLELSDSGVDAPSGRANPRSRRQFSNNRGIGLSNIDERLKALYEKDYNFEISTLPSGALKTIIRIPYQLELSHARRETLDW